MANSRIVDVRGREFLLGQKEQRPNAGQWFGYLSTDGRWYTAKAEAHMKERYRILHTPEGVEYPYPDPTC